MYSDTSLPKPPTQHLIPAALSRLPAQAQKRSSFTPSINTDGLAPPWSLANVGYYGPAIWSYTRINGLQTIPDGEARSWKVYFGVSWDKER
jgi:hypothetical protein